IETVDFEGPLIFRIEEVPVVVRLHLTETAIRRHFGLKIKGMMLRCEKKQLSLYPIWIAVSGYSLELTRQTFGLEPTETKTIYYPIHPPVEKNPEIPPLPPRFVLFAGGRVSRRKGALMLAEAATGFLKKQNDTSLVFVGSLENENGVPIDQSIRNILGPELSRRVSFLGQMSRDQVLAVMRKAAVFAYASTLETFGLVIGEAMLQGCPVVVCEIGPNPEFVEHEKTGLMVPPNDPAAFSNAIERLLENKELAKRLSQAALRQVEERFSLEKSVSESVDFYRSLIQLKTESKG
ncbi:MAG TPA: glycosyltransferase family 4 protein, partial [bacterium]|nr:glycosyltransferase family 4 protein [bacterium]